MLLFKPEHEPLILADIKTETRRRWKKCRTKLGSIHLCKTKMFGKAFAKVKIMGVYTQHLCHMTEENYKAEGNYTRESYIEKWKEINGDYYPLEEVFVVVMERVR